MKSIYTFSLVIITAALFVLISCKYNNELKTKPIKIDLTKTENETFSQVKEEVVPKDFKVAISAIISPREGLQYYERLINFIENNTGIDLNIVQRETYQEVNLMLRNNNVNLAFVCSGAYVVEKEVSDIEIIAVPQTKGKPYYQAYIIVNKNSGIDSFENLKGRSFVYTDPLSNSGRLYALKRLNDLGYNEEEFFSTTTYSKGHDNSIQLVNKGLVDGATIDGLIFDYLKKYNPDRVSNIDIIEKSEYFGIPPVVVPKNLDYSLKTKIKSTLLNMHKDSVGKSILNRLLIDKFIEGRDEDYNSIRNMQTFIKK